MKFSCDLYAMSFLPEFIHPIYAQIMLNYEIEDDNIAKKLIKEYQHDEWYTNFIDFMKNKNKAYIDNGSNLSFEEYCRYN